MVRYSILSNLDSTIHSFPINEEYLDEIDSGIAEKMRWFAKGFYTVEKNMESIRIYNLQVDMRGVVELENRKAPTVGYFEIKNSIFSSGSVK